MPTASSADPRSSAGPRGQPRDQAGARAWLVGPWFDAACIAWAWVPFYLFVVWVLGLDGSWSLGGRDGNGTEPGLGLAMLVALGVSYIHRHYTFLLVYGDSQTFRARVRAFTLVPAALFIGLALILRFQGELSWVLFGVKVRPWALLLILTGAWNMWHTLMQRYGITRIYASKAGGGLQTPAHGRRDRRLMWSAVALTAALTLMFRASTFAGIANARRVLIALDPVIHGWLGWALLAVIAGGTLAVAGSWAKHERAATVEPGQRIPRLNFMASTAALLLVFLVHGPIIGYLCFGVAHGVEYIFFFHVFGRRKFAGRGPDQQQGLAAWLLARPLISGPIIALALTGLFFVLADHRKSEPYLVYYTATSLLHFLYDGWIWKVRKPEVAQHL